MNCGSTTYKDLPPLGENETVFRSYEAARQSELEVEETTAAPAPATAPASDEIAPAADEAATAMPAADETAPCSSSTGKCTPQCRYECTDPVCDEVCTPDCLTPTCQTRCPDMALTNLESAGCAMVCNQPSCQVECPSQGCAGNDCPACKTVCGEPVCTLSCPDQMNCQEYCEQPVCNWKCKAPNATSCPAPECTMTCEAPKGCGTTICSGDSCPDATGMTVVDNVDYGATVGEVEDGSTVTEDPTNTSLLQLEKGALHRHRHGTHLPVVAVRGLDRRKVMLPVKF